MRPRYTYLLLLTFFFEAAVANVLPNGLPGGSLSTIHVSGSVDVPLTRPSFTPLFDQSVHQTDINLVVNRAVDGSFTEIYRSMAASGPYQLIHTEAPGTTNEFLHVDRDVKPRTTFYYKARAVKDGETSEFSDIHTVTSQSKFYPPVLEATANDDSSVEIYFQDISYHDVYYTIYRTDLDGGNEMTIQADLFLLDSGRVEIFGDAPDPNATYIYHVNAEVRDEGFPTYYSVSTDTLFVPPYITLTEPYFDFSHAPANMPCGNEIAFNFGNDNDGSFTEIYRSRAAEGPYELIATEEYQYGSYLDPNLVSRKTYYYMLRAVRAHEVSPFSDTVALESGAQFFNPVLEASVADGTVEIKLHDRSYLDGSYELYAVEQGSTVVTFNQTAVLPDSGQVVTYTDQQALPGKTYIYYANALLACDGIPYVSNVAIDTLQVPDAPAVLSFTLVDPYTDQDVRTLHNHDVISAEGRYNIRADANSRTAHVEFFLNNKRSYDAKEPFALFGNNKDNYHKGKLRPGEYVLTATAYGLTNNRRVKGNTLQISFMVTEDTPENLMAPEIVNVSVFPNPAVTSATLWLSGKPDTPAQVRLVDPSGNTIQHATDVLDNNGLLSRELAVQHIPKGTYYLLITMDDRTWSRRIVVK